MNNGELKENVKFLVKNVLLNTEAQIEWVIKANSDILDAMGAFARLFIEKDEDTTKVDAFRQGFILGAVYESMKGIKEEGGKSD